LQNPFGSQVVTKNGKLEILLPIWWSTSVHHWGTDFSNSSAIMSCCTERASESPCLALSTGSRRSSKCQVILGQVSGIGRSEDETNSIEDGPQRSQPVPWHYWVWLLVIVIWVYEGYFKLFLLPFTGSSRDIETTERPIQRVSKHTLMKPAPSLPALFL